MDKYENDFLQRFKRVNQSSPLADKALIFPRFSLVFTNDPSTITGTNTEHWLCLCFSVFVWTLVPVLVFLSVCMESCARASVPFALSVWTLVLVLRLSVLVWTLVVTVLRFSVFV